MYSIHNARNQLQRSDITRAQLFVLPYSIGKTVIMMLSATC